MSHYSTYAVNVVMRANRETVGSNQTSFFSNCPAKRKGQQDRRFDLLLDYAEVLEVIMTLEVNAEK